jgi:anti-sigma factor RsiW
MNNQSGRRDMAHEDRTFAEDGDLVAYIDGELPPERRAALEEKIAGDPALADRLRILQSGGRPFRQAFDAVLEAAPLERLSAALEHDLRRRRNRSSAGRRLPAWTAVAASLVILSVGLGAGYTLRSFGIPGLTEDGVRGEEADSGAWGQMLASDLALYTPESLAMIGPGQTPTDSELGAVGAKLNVALSADRLALPGLALKQARLLAFRDTPFIQLVYLDPQHGPVAFCIFAKSGGIEAPESSRSAGMNLVYWANDRESYMLIGRAPTRDLQDLAGSLARKFPPSPA